MPFSGGACRGDGDGFGLFHEGSGRHSAAAGFADLVQAEVQDVCAWGLENHAGAGIAGDDAGAGAFGVFEDVHVDGHGLSRGNLVIAHVEGCRQLRAHGPRTFDDEAAALPFRGLIAGRKGGAGHACEHDDHKETQTAHNTPLWMLVSHTLLIRLKTNKTSRWVGNG